MELMAITRLSAFPSALQCLSHIQCSSQSLTMASIVPQRHTGSRVSAQVSEKSQQLSQFFSGAHCHSQGHSVAPGQP